MAELLHVLQAWAVTSWLLNTTTAVSTGSRQRQGVAELLSHVVQAQVGGKMVLDTASAISTAASGVAAELLSPFLKVPDLAHACMGYNYLCGQARIGHAGPSADTA